MNRKPISIAPARLPDNVGTGEDMKRGTGNWKSGGGRYRKISTAFWNDEKILTLSDDGKLAFLLVLSHPHMTSLGAMRASVAGLAAELGWTTERLREAFREAFTKGLLKADEKAFFICLPNFLRHNKPESPNVVRSWERIIPELPECALKAQYLQHVKAFTEGLGEAFTKALPKAFREAFGKPSRNHDPDPDPEQDLRLKTNDLSAHVESGDPESSESPEIVGLQTDVVRSFAERMAEATGDSSFLRNGTLKAIGEILAAGRADDLDAEVDHVAKDQDPTLAEARGFAWVQEPAPYMQAALSRLRRIR